jgi:uncharacterized protein
VGRQGAASELVEASVTVQTTYPGVYVVERPSGAHAISGVSTSVTAFVGAARRGPTGQPVRVFSVQDYVRAFGPAWDEGRPMGHAVAMFFANGGGEAVVVRVQGNGPAAAATLRTAGGSPADTLVVTASAPGSWANRGTGGGVDVVVDTATTSNPADLFTLRVRRHDVDRSGQEVVVQEEVFADLSMAPASPRFVLAALRTSALLTAAAAASPPAAGAAGSSTGGSAITSNVTFSAANNVLRVVIDHGPPVDVTLFAAATSGAGTTSKSLSDIRTELNGLLGTRGVDVTTSGNKLVLTSQRTGADSAVAVVPAPSGDASQSLALGRVWGGAEVSAAAAMRPAPATVPLVGGVDVPPTAADVVPASGTGGVFALRQLDVPRFNLLCLPDLTTDDDTALAGALALCRQERAFLIADSRRGGYGPGTTPPALTNLRPGGAHGAVYFPRVTLAETPPGGVTRLLDLPASGAVAGVFARTDATRGVWKAPAGREAGLVGISGLAAPSDGTPVDDVLSGQYNPRGINVLRTFPGAGTVVWGARTLAGSDNGPLDARYVPVRRLTDHIATSLYLGTAFAVFEPNDEVLWGQLRAAVTAFLRTLHRQHAFAADTAAGESASFFVTCDATVNPSSEVDLGRVNVVVGFAPLKPAEFVVVTITQMQGER